LAEQCRRDRQCECLAAIQGERQWLDQYRAALPLPHTHTVFFKRANEAGEVAGKASSAMAGWRNFKMALGSCKTGKSLGYVNFWNGNDPRLAGLSLELNTVAYTNNGISHTLLTTPQMVFDLAWDTNYQSMVLTSGWQVQAYLRGARPKARCAWFKRD
jgi:hypothetical protein